MSGISRMLIFPIIALGFYHSAYLSQPEKNSLAQPWLVFLPHITLKLDNRLPDKLPSDCKDMGALFLSLDPEHRSSTGLCSQPPPVCPLHLDCMSGHSLNTIINFADDTTLVTNNIKAAYREEGENLLWWIEPGPQHFDLRKKQIGHKPLHIGDEPVERGSSFKFLGVNNTDKLFSHSSEGTAKMLWWLKRAI